MLFTAILRFGKKRLIMEARIRNRATVRLGSGMEPLLRLGGNIEARVRDGDTVKLRGNGPPIFFKLLLYICVLILTILFNIITFCSS